ncbi:panthothenate kinase [Ameyamaea chiangmaiensis NBRC 103196]|uniref:Nucleoside/nucleotide kinase family protein n=1 Tax=Ameyamaea chiangmaiensis TaxID=442969 RepID=A0A850PHF8_9PROT|nr:nucleoside/nucleotide kinase family protein [Ameyamaea chiangmaiensis]MBS4075186.1 nucleoside/nucleotide kinase family protein [Ameyamaea chiangmaiensis]NVN41282.1 nucleoside/nucleotide kinase family protein [Ameyamaea chiangmaiensis]GBQ66346.1 panthothenate kinase [Ameyamaea chiangmaiensis NBRC 103196]
MNLLPSLLPPVPPDALRSVEALLARGDRVVLGIAGPPGAGKSTLAEALVAAVGGAAMVVPMDGFHLAQRELERLGRAGRKGAPDTFDVLGYVALLDRLRVSRPGEWVYAPFFDRTLEEPLAGAIAVPDSVRLVISEGNYLLHDGGFWSRVRGCLDACWYVDVPEDERVRRLVGRHCRFGRTDADARDWVMRTDMPNARLVEATRARADLVVPWHA